MDAFQLVLACVTWVEHYFGSSESLIANQDFSSIWQLIVLFTLVRLLSFFEGVVVVVNYIAHFLFDVTHNLQLSVSCERVASFVEDLLEILSDVSSCQVDSLDCVGNSVALVDWNSMRYAIS